ncbi:hypothetical protein ACHAXN_000679, partial [Cyclotella atomus]
VNLETVCRQNKLDGVWYFILQNQLVEYKGNNGHCKVPHDHPLGLWAARQRSNRTKMSQERINKLESIGFDWSVRATNKWDENYAELEKYQQENGHCKVPHDHPLGPWAARQISKQAEMSQDRIDKLDRIGFIWD